MIAKLASQFGQAPRRTAATLEYHGRTGMAEKELERQPRSTGGASARQPSGNGVPSQW